MVLAFTFLPSNKKEWLLTTGMFIVGGIIAFFLIKSGNINYLIYLNNVIYWFWVIFWIFVSLCAVYWIIKGIANKVRRKK